MAIEQEKILKGTTTVGLIFDKGVVLAADKRASMSNFIAAKDVDKIHQISGSMAMTIAGGVGDAQTLVRLIRAELEIYKYTNGESLSVNGASTLLANVLQGNKYYPYMVQLIVAGFDVQPRLFDLDPLGGLIPEKCVSTGSGSITAYGYLDQGYKDGLNQQDAIRLAAKSVAAAMKRDSATGEGIDVVVITKDGVKRLSKSDVNQFLA